MESNAILKLSNKNTSNNLKLKIEETQKAQVQTELVDSMTQRINLIDQQSELIVPNSPANSKEKKNSKLMNGSKSIDNSQIHNSQINNSNIRNSKLNNSKSLINGKTPPETPVSQSKVNEIIYYNNANDNYGEPAVENNLNNSEVVNQSFPGMNPLDNVGTLPVDVDCPFCNAQIKSTTESKCNCLVVFLYILMIIIFPLMCIASLYKAGTGTSNCCACYYGDEGLCDCCNDVKHICPKCGKVIAESDSCSRLFSCI